MANAQLDHPELPGISTYLLRVTPELAKEMLARNTKGQRTISAGTVERYASDMETEDWQFNGAPILLSSKNELLDGQHRLSAIVESGRSQILLIVHGVDADAMATIDAGRGRSYADILKIREFVNHTTVAALTARVWQWFHGNYSVGNVPRVATPLHLGSAPSHAQRDYWMDKVEKAYGITFAHAATFANTAYAKRRGISRGTYAFVWVILSGIDKDLREGFFEDLLNTDLNYVRSPQVQALHNRLNRIRPREDFDSVDQVDAIFTTYNAWVKNTPLNAVNPPRPVRWNTLEMPVDYVELGA